MFIMCYNLEVFVCKKKRIVFLLLFFFVGRGEGVCIGRTSGLSSAVSDLRLKLNVLVVGMMGVGAVPPVSRSTGA